MKKKENIKNKIKLNFFAMLMAVDEFIIRLFFSSPPSWFRSINEFLLGGGWCVFYLLHFRFFSFFFSGAILCFHVFFSA